jgi:hypothetical protein
LSFFTSPAQPLMVAGEDALRRWAIVAGTARLDAAMAGCQSGEAQPAIVNMATVIDFGCPKV